jgi:hypothetical protein
MKDKLKAELESITKTQAKLNKQFESLRTRFKKLSDRADWIRRVALPKEELKLMVGQPITFVPGYRLHKRVEGKQAVLKSIGRECAHLVFNGVEGEWNVRVSDIQYPGNTTEYVQL